MQKGSLSIILIAVVSVIACDNPIWPKESNEPQPFCMKYDSLQLTLWFDRDLKLDRFWLHRPLTQVDSLSAFVVPDSLVIPLKGAFGIQFNSSYEEARKIFGEPRSYYYIVSDTGVFVTAGWSFKDRTSIDLSFLNDSLSVIDSDVEWAKLPDEITIGTTRDSILLRYGKPGSAWETKSWFIEPLQIFGIDFWVKSPQKISGYLYYWDQRLQLNLDRNNRFEEWVLRRSFSKSVTMTQTAFDSSVIPKVGACGIFFNASADTIIKILGDYHSYGWLDMDSTISTSFNWRWNDSLYMSFELTNDSLRVIRSNAGWIQLPKGIKIGDTKADIIKEYGKPSLTYKIGFIYSFKRLNFK